MKHILEAHHIHKSYAEHTALQDVSISIPSGSIFGLLGPNGAGKTSLIRIINHITGPDSGHILFDDQPLNPSHIANIGYLTEEIGLYKKMKVGDQLLYLAQLKGLSKKEAMDKLKYWFKKFEIQAWWEKNVEDLSKGMQQKIQFVATVLHEPKLIILDEPFSGFDPINANLIKDEILELREKGSTIIFSTHRMESVEELCDYVALIHKSHKILDGSKKEIKQQFKTNTYTLEYVGQLPSSDLYSIVEYLPDTDEKRKVIIKLSKDTPLQTLQHFLIDQVELRFFSENIPSMNEIFIRCVQENN
ncbi:MAG: ABC transporter ATP-binding protein [Spirosomataceae bacterium]